MSKMSEKSENLHCRSFSANNLGYLNSEILIRFADFQFSKNDFMHKAKTTFLTINHSFYTDFVLSILFSRKCCIAASFQVCDAIQKAIFSMFCSVMFIVYAFEETNMR